MEAVQATPIISLLADGIDPVTGEIYPQNSPYHHPVVIRALHVALKGLDKLEKSERRQKNLPDNAGKPWTEEEEAELLKLFDEGYGISELSRQHGRTQTAIRSRLMKAGKISF